LRAERQIGLLEVGKFAGIIALQNNFFTVPEKVLGRQKLLLIMMGSEVMCLAQDAGPDFDKVTAKFLNGRSMLARRAIGGFDRAVHSRKGKAAVAKLRKRQMCVHQH
jgi:hypothetical protein